MGKVAFTFLTNAKDSVNLTFLPSYVIISQHKMRGEIMMNKTIVPNSFVAVSDFHSMEWPLDKVKKII